MHLSCEQMQKDINEQKANLVRLSHQFNAGEFEVVLTKTLALVVLLQKLIAEQTRERKVLESDRSLAAN
jgi:hypothetical protein